MSKIWTRDDPCLSEQTGRRWRGLQRLLIVAVLLGAKTNRWPSTGRYESLAKYLSINVLIKETAARLSDQDSGAALARQAITGNQLNRLSKDLSEGVSIGCARDDSPISSVAVVSRFVVLHWQPSPYFCDPIHCPIG